MPEPIDDLARQWSAQPDRDRTIALCDALGQMSRAAPAVLVDEVGKRATELHADDSAVTLALARLYAAVDRLAEAHRTLLVAGRVAPRDPTVFRLLGEVLLRRGEATTAETMFHRAQQLGANDASTAAWLERAAGLKALEAQAGAHAVAVEVNGAAEMAAMAPDTTETEVLGVSRARSSGPPRSHPVVSVDTEGATVVRPTRTEWTEEETKREGIAQARSIQRDATVQLDAIDLMGAQGTSTPPAPGMPARSRFAGGTAPMPIEPRLGGGHPASVPPAFGAPPVPAPSWPAPAHSSAPAPHSPPDAARDPQRFDHGSALTPSVAPRAFSPSVPPAAGSASALSVPPPAAPVAMPSPVAAAPPKRARKALIVGILLAGFMGGGAVAIAAFELFSDAHQEAPRPQGKHGKR